jgi:hypothetical protein
MAAGLEPVTSLSSLARAMSAASGHAPLGVFVELLTPLLPVESGAPAASAGMVEAMLSIDRVRRRRAVLAWTGD